MAAVLAGARPHVDEPVGAAHHLLVVLDDDHGVAEVAQALERADQLVVVALVQADRRLVEDVEHADELRADLRREPQALRLAARERRARAVEVEVADADVVEERQPLADLLDDALRRSAARSRSARGRSRNSQRARDRELRELVDVLLADGDREHLGLEPRALADRARPERHVLLDALALRRRVRLAVAALERRDDPLEVDHVRAAPAHPVAVLDVDLVAVGAVEEVVLLLLGQLLPRDVGRDLVAVGDRLDHRLVEPGAADRPRHERAVVDRERRVGHEQVRVDLLLRAEAGAARARAVRRVEREDARLELGQRDAVLRAGEVLAVRRALRPCRRGRSTTSPSASCARGLDRLRQPRAQVLLHHEPVDDDLDRVLELLVERRRLVERVLLAVDLDAREALVAKLLEALPVLALAVAHDRRVDREARALGQREDLLDDRVDRLAGDRPAADGAVRPAHARVEQAQVVVDLGHGADRRARVARGRLLVDRDRGAEAVDRVDVRLLHHLQELARVRARATRRSGAGPRRRSCRRQGSTSRSRRAR